MRYAVVEIAGRQYKVLPKKAFKVNSLGEVKEYVCDKVLLLAGDGGVEIGKPYLKDSLKFTVEGPLKDKKIRVATYHAKANTRKVKGSRAVYSLLTLSVKQAV
jgi:ribosomal protein L21